MGWIEQRLSGEIYDWRFWPRRFRRPPVKRVGYFVNFFCSNRYSDMGSPRICYKKYPFIIKIFPRIVKNGNELTDISWNFLLLFFQPGNSAARTQSARVTAKMIITNLFFPILLVSVSAKPFNPFNPFEVSVGKGCVPLWPRFRFGLRHFGQDTLDWDTLDWHLLD